MTELRFVMWNCSGFLPSSSANEKLQFLESSDSFDVLILIETHHKSIDDVKHVLHRHSSSYKLFHTVASSDDPYAGIIVLVGGAYEVSDFSVVLAGRLINFKLQYAREKYNISVMYGYPGSKTSVHKLENFIDELNSHHDPADNNVLLGDFNFVEYDIDRTQQNKTGRNYIDMKLCGTWSDFLQTLGLVDPFRVRNPKRRYFSYIHTQHNAKSRIDRMYVNEEMCGNIFHYKHTAQALWPKAHRLVSFSIRESAERGPGFWKMNTSILTDRAYAVIVETSVADVKSLNIVDPIERWLIFIETVRIEAQVYCSKKRSLERLIKSDCEKNIELLEQNPALESSVELQAQHEYFTQKLSECHRKKIDGYQIRIKTQPRFEHGEPNIAFYSNLEKKYAKKKEITHLMDSQGEMKTDVDGMKTVATNFYSELFDVKPSDNDVAQRLLQNVTKKVTANQRLDLDRLITKEELLQAIMKLHRNKSPGPDGIPAEFYQVFWHIIHDLYFDFITEVKRVGFPESKNTSITSLIYKERGDVFLLANYRPIALMNVDVKILTKLLSMRLALVLPNIIHESQTAVPGRRLGDNVHLVRDIIDYANKNDEEAALLFLDQEKAFDRVNHSFLVKVLKAFGLGDVFVHWIELLYTNACTKIDMNGHLTRKIRLRSGVRQGCPLSPLLYVMVIEILALQLRANPNIVGFTIQGQKILSSHYADDAVIKITQNQCFKEVYKELQFYERATGAKVNYEKTKGLWIGGWKHRTDDPFIDLYSDPAKTIKWSNTNVLYVGVYVGNVDPDLKTFTEIVPRVRRRLNFWKPLKFPILAKARVIEIFHASKLFYAASFYPIPASICREIDDMFMNYITFPKGTTRVSRMELEKLRESGGIKLINMQLKAQTPKIHWLIRLMVEGNLKVHKAVFEALMDLNDGGLRGCDMIFAEPSFVNSCNFVSPFYREAFLGLSKLNRWKHFTDINNEHLFFNPIFTTTPTNDEMHDPTLKPFRGNKILASIQTYGDLLRSEEEITQPRLLAVLRRKKDSIHHIRESVESHLIYSLCDGQEHTFKAITQKIIYREIICEKSRDHAYVGRWRPDTFLGVILWNEIWQSIHKSFFSEAVKSTIWDQIHLNFYTTYNFNKWYNTLNPCPLCRKIPDDVFHIILYCKFTRVLWKRAEKTLVKIMPKLPTLHELAFGIQPRNSKDECPTILRNWITFFMRHHIALEERRVHNINVNSQTAYTPSVEKFFASFNYLARQELRLKEMQFAFRGLSRKFEKIVTVNGAIVEVVNGEYNWKDIL